MTQHDHSRYVEGCFRCDLSRDEVRVATTEQPHLFDIHRANEARDEAISRVELNADPDWVLEALRAVYAICRVRTTFTSDAIWALLDQRGIYGPHEPKALGSVMRTAQRRGWCRPTATYSNSQRVECHRRPLRVWESVGLRELPEWDQLH
jgi:hypothetical protein